MPWGDAYPRTCGNCGGNCSGRDFGAVVGGERPNEPRELCKDCAIAERQAWAERKKLEVED